MFSYQNIEQYHRDLVTGRTSVKDAVNYYLDKIRQHEKLNAFVEVYEQEALEKAAQLDNKRKAGAGLKKLHGVVIAIKDVLCYKDHKVTAASGILKNFVSQYNATAVQLMLDEDAVIIGSCNCDEFAMGSTNEHSVYGPAINATGENLVPGGSSGGSAVAVQAGMCMLSLGSDTGGSVRQPADFCGIIGFKPAYGSISRYGLIAYASSFDQVGIFGTCMPDVATLYEVISKPDDFDSTMNHSTVNPSSKKTMEQEDKKYRFCYFRQMLNHPLLDKEIAGGILSTAEKVKAAGHTVEEIEFELIDYIVPAYYVLTTAEASSNLSRYDGIRYGHRSAKPAKDLASFYMHNRSEGFGMEVKRRIMLGTFVLSAGYYDAYFNKAQQVRKLLTEKTKGVFKNYDFILLPNSPTTAYPLGKTDQDPTTVYLADIFTVFANLSGIPAISLPLYRHSNGLPYGLQVMSDKTDDLTLLDISASLMKFQNQTQAL